MRKLIAVFLALAICLFTGCNKANTDTPQDSSYTTTSINQINSQPGSDFGSTIFESDYTSGTHSTTTSESGVTSHEFASNPKQNSGVPSEGNAAASSEDKTPADNPPIATGDLKAVWISYYELNFKGKTEKEFRSTIDNMFDQIKNIGLNAVICHVRPNADSYYPSQYFPWSANLTGTQGYDPGYDPLKYMVQAAHRRGLQFHAWLNPYRVSSRFDDISQLAENHPARIWLSDGTTENDDWAVRCNGGIYFNPAIPEVQKLIIDGIREIISNYDVDGIHLDDYFYPTTSPDFDKAAYQRYVNTVNGKPLSLADWRRANVNSLVQGIYRAVHEKQGVSFGISPSAHISSDKSDKNYNELYADITLWMSNSGYIDYIAPQLYFGFEYPNDKFKFNNLLNQWMSLNRHHSVKIFIGLPAYKIGTLDAGSDEWIKAGDILKRQVEQVWKAKADGFIIYSYSGLTSQEQLNKTQLDNLRSLLK